MSVKEVKMTTLLMFIHTSSLIYDDRVRKEAKSLSSIYDVTVFSFENDIKHPLDNYQNIKVVRNLIWLRRLFGSAKFIFFKIMEMYIKFAAFYLKNKPHTVYFHNIESMGMVFFFWIGKKIWF